MEGILGDGTAGAKTQRPMSVPPSENHLEAACLSSRRHRNAEWELVGGQDPAPEHLDFLLWTVRSQEYTVMCCLSRICSVEPNKV